MGVKTKSRYNADQLHDYCLEEVSITCSKCIAIAGEYNMDAYDAMVSFFKKGWRATSANCYCPKCAKKHLKL